MLGNATLNACEAEGINWWCWFILSSGRGTKGTNGMVQFGYPVWITDWESNEGWLLVLASVSQCNEYVFETAWAVGSGRGSGMRGGGGGGGSGGGSGGLSSAGDSLPPSMVKLSATVWDVDDLSLLPHTTLIGLLFFLFLCLLFFLLGGFFVVLLSSALPSCI